MKLLLTPIFRGVFVLYGFSINLPLLTDLYSEYGLNLFFLVFLFNLVLHVDRTVLSQEGPMHFTLPDVCWLTPHATLRLKVVRPMDARRLPYRVHGHRVVDDPSLHVDTALVGFGCLVTYQYFLVNF